MRERDVALAAAEEASEILLRSFKRGVAVSYKGRHNPVTEADRKAELAVIDIIRSAYPEHSIFGEETGRHAGSRARWLVDALDGTNNFIAGSPDFGVMVAFAPDGISLPAVGVIYLPAHGQRYVAERGKGVTLNGERIRVSSRGFSDAIVEMDTGYEHLSAGLRDMAGLAGKIQRFKMRYSPLSVCELACGVIDGDVHYEMGPQEAAGALLVTEAGGKVTDLRGRPYTLSSDTMLATNGKIHREILNSLRP